MTSEGSPAFRSAFVIRNPRYPRPSASAGLPLGGRPDRRCANSRSSSGGKVHEGFGRPLKTSSVTCTSETFLEEAEPLLFCPLQAVAAKTKITRMRTSRFLLPTPRAGWRPHHDSG